MARGLVGRLGPVLLLAACAGESGADPFDPDMTELDGSWSFRVSWTVSHHNGGESQCSADGSLDTGTGSERAAGGLEAFITEVVGSCRAPNGTRTTATYGSQGAYRIFLTGSAVELREFPSGQLLRGEMASADRMEGAGWSADRRSP